MEVGDVFVCKAIEEFEPNMEHLKHDAVHFETFNGKLIWVGFNHDGKSYYLALKKDK